MAAIIPIASTILTGIEFATKVGKVRRHPPSATMGRQVDSSVCAQIAGAIIPSPEKKLKDYHRWIQCTLKNETQFQITVLDSYFNSGRYWDSLTTVNPFAQMGFSLCSSHGSILTGVSGGTAFRTTMNEPVHFDFAVESVIGTTGVDSPSRLNICYVGMEQSRCWLYEG